MSVKPIRVGIIGVGNCAKSLVEGVALYAAQHGRTEGLTRLLIGGYAPKNIEFAVAWEVDVRKVGLPLCNAIYAPPNCAMDLGVSLIELKNVGASCIVKRGYLLDGVSEHMRYGPEDQIFKPSVDVIDELAFRDEFIGTLEAYGVDVVVNYLPVGSEEATRFYLDACLTAKVPFVNCIPVFIASDPHWDDAARYAGVPIIGDDMRSQFGASVLSQALQEVLLARGIRVKIHEQINHGGNTDFRNMLNTERLASKKISKENVIRATNELRGIPIPKDGIYAGPASYIPYHKDNKIANFHIEGEGFGGAPISFDAKLSVQDSPNSAGVVIDAIRYLQVARELGLVGSLRGPSAFTQKTPIVQMELADAIAECDALAERRLTPLVRQHNMPKVKAVAL